MKFLKDLFNRQTSVFVPLDTLAQIAAPLHVEAELLHNRATVGKAWDELTDWTRIGFELEKEKGLAFNALYITLRHISSAVNGAAPDAKGVYIRKDDLRVLATTCWQMAQSAEGLRTIAKTQDKGPKVRYETDELGRRWETRDFSNMIQIYNRPDADHMAAADQLMECLSRLNTYFAQQPVKKAPDHLLEQYKAELKLYR